VIAGNGVGPASAATDNEAHKTNNSDDLGEIARLVAAKPHRANSGRHRHAERGADLYETPAVAVDALLRVERRLPHRVWEPACGLGMYCREHRPAPNTISPERAPPPRSQSGSSIGGQQNKEK
jgi:hypothetical protein